MLNLIEAQENCNKYLVNLPEGYSWKLSENKSLKAIILNIAFKGKLISSMILQDIVDDLFSVWSIICGRELDGKKIAINVA